MRNRVSLAALFLVSTVFVSTVFMGTLFLAPLGAHTEVWQRSPANGLAYGGEIDRVQISFIATVESSEISLTGPDGAQVDTGATELERGNRVAVAKFSKLTEPGRYIVAHTELAPDGDIQTDAYQFFFDPESDNRVESLVGGENGPNWILLGIISGVVLILAGIFWPSRSTS